MALFKINGTTVKKITAKDLDLERNLQVLFEANLDELLNISFLAHEYSTSSGGRIYTLCIKKKHFIFFFTHPEHMPRPGGLLLAPGKKKTPALFHKEKKKERGWPPFFFGPRVSM